MIGGCGLAWSRTGASQANEILEDFKAFCKIDLQLQKGSIKNHASHIKRYLQLNPNLNASTIKDVRSFLASYIDKSQYTYANCLKAVKVFFRDYVKRPDLVQSFKFPKIPFKPKIISTKKELRCFYYALTTLKDKALFLFYATSGHRRSEILGLNVDDIDFEKQMIIPSNSHKGSTKNSWVSFYNDEAKNVLNEYLSSRRISNPKLFPMARSKLTRLWGQTRDKTKLNITPQKLREWFCVEMAELGIQDRYIDAFCGRTPKSVLARHYTDYSPKRLKRIYDKADLKVLS